MIVKCPACGAIVAGRDDVRVVTKCAKCDVRLAISVEVVSEPPLVAKLDVRQVHQS